MMQLVPVLVVTIAIRTVVSSVACGKRLGVPLFHIARMSVGESMPLTMQSLLYNFFGFDIIGCMLWNPGAAPPDYEANVQPSVDKAMLMMSSHWWTKARLMPFAHVSPALFTMMRDDIYP